MEAIPWEWVVASNPRRIGLISAPISLHVYHDFRRDFRHDFRHDRATIRPRSGVNHDARASSIAFRSKGNKSALIPRPNPLDRGSIAPRSWSSSTAPPRRPIELQVTGGSRSHDRDPLSSSVRWRSNGVDAMRRHLSKNN